MMQPYQRKQAGFTIGEMTVVLGVVALVMGGVWVTVNKVQETAQITQTKEQVIAILSKVRGFYQTRACINTGNQTGFLLGVGQPIFPREMVNGGGLTDLWNGAVQLQGAGAACDQQFTINFLALPAGICGYLLPQLTGSGEVSRGLRAVTINGSNASITRFPINPTDIIGTGATQCGAGATANVALTYVLRVSQ